MENSDFRKNVKVEEKDLIPLEPLDRCLWVKDKSNKASEILINMKDCLHT